MTTCHSRGGPVPPVVDWSILPSDALAAEAAVYRHDNDDGSAFFFHPSKGDWRYQQLDPRTLDAFADADEAGQWISAEIDMHRQDGHDSTADDYQAMLAHGVTDPVVVTMIGPKARLWDGWHRTAIAMVRGEPLAAIVGVRREPCGDLIT